MECSSRLQISLVPTGLVKFEAFQNIHLVELSYKMLYMKQFWVLKQGLYPYKLISHISPVPGGVGVGFWMMWWPFSGRVVVGVGGGTQGRVGTGRACGSLGWEDALRSGPSYEVEDYQ